MVSMHVTAVFSMPSDVEVMVDFARVNASPIQPKWVAHCL